MAVAGVESVTVTRMQRLRMTPAGELAAGVVHAAALDDPASRQRPERAGERPDRDRHVGRAMSGAPCECSACKGTELVTPAAHENAPGLSTLAWRVGTHGQFKESMLTSIGRQPALAKLTTRADDDSTIALMDAWAASLDVLAFYQERYANENYLRTATERRSVLELARMIGYELRPGVAGEHHARLYAGDRAGFAAERADRGRCAGDDDARPGRDAADLRDGRGAGGARRLEQLHAGKLATRYPMSGDASVRLDGAAVNLRAGDMVLIAGTERLGQADSDMVAIRRALQVKATPATPDNPAYTDVLLDKKLDDNTPQFAPAFYVLRQNTGLFGASALDWASLPDATKAAYVNQADGTDRGNWPDFSICGVSERAPAGTASAVADGNRPSTASISATGIRRPLRRRRRARNRFRSGKILRHRPAAALLGAVDEPVQRSGGRSALCRRGDGKRSRHHPGRRGPATRRESRLRAGRLRHLQAEILPQAHGSPSSTGRRRRRLPSPSPC